MEKIWLKNYPEGVPHNIDDQKTTLPAFLDSSAKKYPDNAAIIFFGRKIKYKELLQLVNNFACSLSKLGIKKGDRVAIYLPNCPQAIISYFAALKTGAIVVLINPLYMEKELEHQINDSGAETLIFIDILSNKVDKILNNTSLKTLIVTNFKEFVSFPLNFLFNLGRIILNHKKINIEGTHSFNELLSEKGYPPKVNIDPEKDIAILQYTGGTTGISKGVILTHYNLVSNVIQAQTWFCNIEMGKEILLAALPFFHVFGMTVGMNFPIFTGSAIIVVPKFKVQVILKLINKYRPTIFPGVPSMYIAINNYPSVKKYNLSSIKFCLSGAAPLPVEVAKKFERLTKGKLVEGYGLTEASPITHCNPLFNGKREGSIGLPLPSTNCKIVDIKKRNKELPLGKIGELAVKGPQVMKGYWNLKDEDENVLNDGWLYTGDIAEMDEDGYCYIVARKKNLIITGGMNVYPREVEEVLIQHQKVSEAAVVGTYDEYMGEAVYAYIVLNRGYMASETEIIEFCKKKIAKYKVPKCVEFREKLPKNIIGKVLRRMIHRDDEVDIQDIFDI